MRFAAPDLWARISDAHVPAAEAEPALRRTLLDDDAAASFPFFAPSNERYWSDSWALHRVSAGYAWGRGVGGRGPSLAQDTRVCLIGELDRAADARTHSH